MCSLQTKAEEGAITALSGHSVCGNASSAGGTGAGKVLGGGRRGLLLYSSAGVKGGERGKQN